MKTIELIGIAKSGSGKGYELSKHTYQGIYGNMNRISSVVIAHFNNKKIALTEMNKLNGVK